MIDYHSGVKMDNGLEWLGSMETDEATRGIHGIFQDIFAEEYTYNFGGSQTRRLI